MISLFRKLGTKTKGGANQSAITTTSLIGATLAATLIASPAFAGGSGMPWEGPLQQVVDSFTAWPSLNRARDCDVASLSCLVSPSLLPLPASSWASLVLGVEPSSADPPIPQTWGLLP
jgi:TrbC/VIRB2 pilin